MDVDKRRAERFTDVCEDTLTASTAKARIKVRFVVSESR